MSGRGKGDKNSERAGPNVIAKHSGTTPRNHQSRPPSVVCALKRQRRTLTDSVDKSIGLSRRTLKESNPTKIPLFWWKESYSRMTTRPNNFFYSARYQDNEYEYRHVHITKEVSFNNHRNLF
ncbi:hypothetical protein WR25_22940 [Diploscapter pachys]|uniref:Uncharacterized protein n=1 Tax=Diploscapter pachys TaxID=2018661 RepID=A0A2A2JGQ6_9BILA|nr:hypothetical protein WR25_22940 [Diploscapter pachys]